MLQGNKTKTYRGRCDRLSVSIVLQPYQEVTRPKSRFKHTLPKKSEVDGEGRDQVATYLLVSHFTYTPYYELVHLLSHEDVLCSKHDKKTIWQLFENSKI